MENKTNVIATDYTGRKCERGLFHEARAEETSYGGVILYVTDDRGQTFSIYNQNDADPDEMLADAREYWECIETQGWVLEGVVA